MFKRARLMYLFSILLGLAVLGTSNQALSQEVDACKQCMQQKRDARWALRQDCLSKGGNQQSCNGQITGPTCCHCEKGPAEDPFCWDVICAAECWMNQCAEVCD